MADPIPLVRRIRFRFDVFGLVREGPNPYEGCYLVGEEIDVTAVELERLDVVPGRCYEIIDRPGRLMDLSGQIAICKPRNLNETHLWRRPVGINKAISCCAEHAHTTKQLIIYGLL